MRRDLVMAVSLKSPLAGAAIVGGVFFLVGFWLLHEGPELQRWADSISKWQAVEGELLRAEAVEEYVASRGPRLQWVPKLHYRYLVKGVTYDGTHLAVGRDNSPDRIVVERWLREALGEHGADTLPRPVTVFYDASHPASAYLDRKNYSAAPIAAKVLGWLSVATGIYVTAFFVRMHLRKRTAE